MPEHAKPTVRRLAEPDEVREFGRVRIEFVRLGELTIAHSVCQPGWRWTVDVGPNAGTDRCQVAHRGLLVSGHLRLEWPDGGTVDLTDGDVYDLPPDHEAWVVGDAPVVMYDMAAAISEFGRPTSGERVLMTLLFTDIVGSTQHAERLGDREWKRLIALHDTVMRNEVERYRGHLVDTTGDGIFARFDGAARALQAALAISAAGRRLGLAMRCGVHTGEVEVSGGELRGLTVHEAARIMAAAGADEVLLSDLTQRLAAGAGLAFEDRGEVTLRGISGPQRLYALTPSTVP